MIEGPYRTKPVTHRMPLLEPIPPRRHVIASNLFAFVAAVVTLTLLLPLTFAACACAVVSFLCYRKLLCQILAA